MSDYGESYSSKFEESKLRVVVRPVQSGKTAVCIKEISRDIERNPKNIHFIFTMNNIIAQNQLTTRLSSEDKLKIIILNSKKNDQCEIDNCNLVKKVDKMEDVLIECLDPTTRPNVIIMCCNKYRLHDRKAWNQKGRGVLALLGRFQNINEPDTKVIVHIDEIHKYISDPFREAYEDIADLNIVEKIIGYTATAKPLYIDRKSTSIDWRNLHTVDQSYMMIDKDLYFGISKHEHVETSTTETEYFDRNVSDFVLSKANYKGLNKTFVEESVFLGPEYSYMNKIYGIMKYSICLDKLNDTYCRYFIPAMVRRVTHWKVAEMAIEMAPKCTTIVINGLDADGIGGVTVCYWDEFESKRKMLQIKLTSKKELNEEIHDLLKNPNFSYLKRHPIIITGYYSVGMSVSLPHPEYGNFDGIVLVQEIANDEDLYQLCRSCFSLQKWNKNQILKNYVKTKLYCNKNIYERIIRYESLSFEMAECSGIFTHTNAGVNKLKKPRQKMVRNTETANFQEFPISQYDMDEGKTWNALKTYANKNCNGYSPHEKVNKDENGFYLNILRSKRKVMSKEEVYKLGTTALNQKTTRRVDVCYENTNDVNTLVYVLRWYPVS